MNLNTPEKIGARVLAWKQRFADVGEVCGRLRDLMPRYDGAQHGLEAATDEEQVKAQFAAMAETLKDAEQLFRELELAAAAAKGASRDVAAQLRKLK